jgi:ribosomal protein L12E/L44/L45/RPP1/RPP2
LKEGDVVRVRMEKHLFKTNDDCILAVGSLYKGPPGGPEREEGKTAEEEEEKEKAEEEEADEEEAKRTA